MNRRDALCALGLGSLALSETLFASPATQKVGEGEGLQMEGFANGEFVLPPLPYDYKALEPHIDEATMRLHHDKHHAGYVKGANKALSQLKEMASGGNTDLIKHWERELSFHGSGHILHTLFWRNMSPEPGKPSEALMNAINKGYGSLNNLIDQFTAATVSVEASGWGMLAYHPLTDSLVVLQIEKHQDLALHGSAPLMVCDAWEHAYYLKYQNRRDEFVKAFWNVADWGEVSRRYEVARSKS